MAKRDRFKATPRSSIMKTPSMNDSMEMNGDPNESNSTPSNSTPSIGINTTIPNTQLSDVIGLGSQVNQLKQLIDQLIKANKPSDAKSGDANSNEDANSNGDANPNRDAISNGDANSMDAKSNGDAKESGDEKVAPKAKRFLPNGVLIHGFQGTGKSLTAHALVNTYKDQLFTLYVDATSIVASTNEKIMKRLKSTFDQVIEMKKPSLIIFDHLDEIFTAKKSTSLAEKEVPSMFKKWFNDVISVDNSILLIGVTNNLDAIDPLRWPGKFERQIEFHVPLAEDRRQILSHLIESLTKSNGVSSTIEEDAINNIADAAFGYTGADLLCVVKKTIQGAFSNRENLEITEENLTNAISTITPSAMREMKLECQPIHWSSIGGVESIKKEIDQIVIWPIQAPFCNFYTAMGLSKSTGILLYGPPGCSKTMIGQAIATESKLNFLSIRGPELFSKYVGDSEKSIRDLFSKARSAAPSMIFIDEIDALAPARGSSIGNSGVGDRMVNTLLIEMDGIQSLKDVVVIGATNRPLVIDPALKRPGRFDREIYVPLPDENARREIFLINLKNRPIDGSVDVEKLASLTEGFSGAEIAGVVKRAALKAIEDHVRVLGISDKFENLKISDKGSSPNLASEKIAPSGEEPSHNLTIKQEHFSDALKIKPRTSKEMIQSFEVYYRSCIIN